MEELISACEAANGAAARAHKQLSMLHLDRFVTLMTEVADRVHDGPPVRASGQVG